MHSFGSIRTQELLCRKCGTSFLSDVGRPSDSCLPPPDASTKRFPTRMDGGMTPSVRPRLSHQTLAWARQASGLEPADVAKSAGVTLDRYRGWEAGEDRPTFRQLRQLANKLKRPLALFYLTRPPVEPESPRDFRLLGDKRSSYGPELRLELRKATRTQFLAASLAEELGLDLSPSFPSASTETDPEMLGWQLRTCLRIPVADQVAVGDPGRLYRSWRDAVFDLGVLTLQFGLDRREALGFALWHDVAPVVAVNTRQTPAAKSFTLLHELAHVALRMPGVSDAALPFQTPSVGQSGSIERFCNHVAAAVLLLQAANEVHEALDALVRRDLDLRAVRSQAHRFGVSKYAIAYRLSTLRPETRELVEQRISTWFAIDQSSNSDTKKSKKGPPPALASLGKRGKGFSRRVLTAVRESRLSFEDARDLLDLEPHHFSKLEEFVFKPEPEEDDTG